MATMAMSAPGATFRHHPISCFAAGFLSVMVFQMGAWAILYALGILPNPPFSYNATKPFGVPQIWSWAFWGGAWGLVFGIVERWFPQGPGYYLAAFVFGALACSLALWFIVFPLKGLPMAAGWKPVMMLIHLGLHGAFGLGLALLLTYRDGRLQVLRA